MADKAKLLKVAQKHLSKGNLDKAIKTFRQLVEVDPRDQRLILRLADILARAGRKKEAVENYEKVASVYIKQDFTPKAIAVYKTILRLDPELLSAYEKLAQLYKNQGLEAEALSQFENLFQVYEKKNDEAKQIEVLKLMADMDPENLGFQVRLGETLAKKGRKKEAAEAFAKAAATLSRRGFHDRASQLFEKITALDPDNTVVRRELCAHYLESGQFDQARAEIEAILKVEPQDPRMVLLLSRILFQLGNKKEGEEKLGESIQLFLNAGELESVMREFLFVAQSHLNNGEMDEAEAFYRQITTNVPGEVRAIKGLISLAEARKDRVGQIENLLLLARTMQQSGDQKGASDAYHRIHAIDPLNEEAKGYLERMPPSEAPTETDHEPSLSLEADGLAEDIPEAEDLEDLESVEEIEEVALLGETGEGELEELPEGSLEGGIEFSLGEEAEEFILDDETPVEFVEEVMEEGAVPDIVLEDLEEEEVGEEAEVEVEEEEEVEEFLIEVSGEMEEDQEPVQPGPAQAGGAQEEYQEEYQEEMSLEEILAEADVYERYGLKDKVMETLERARAVAPYDQTVASRIAAFESGAAGEAVLPSDGALSGQGEEVAPPHAVEETGKDPFEEDLEEADFYRSQGLDDEASRIYRAILDRDPAHERASEALSSLEGGKGPDGPPGPELPVEAVLETHFDPGSAMEVKSRLIVEDAVTEDMGGFLDIADDLRSELSDEMDAGSDPGAGDGPVSFEEIFSQFKKGIEETLGDEEYETHYNLGIAYKDMGLYDDAIREFESGARDPSLAQDSFSLMAMCYTEKKEYEAAVKAIKQALDVSQEGYRAGLYFQLAEVREKQKDWAEALSAYEQVRSSDPAFQGIGEAIQRVQASLSDVSREAAPDDLSGEGSVEDMLSDLIREVEEMARETTDDGESDPDKSKKDRISYL